MIFDPWKIEGTSKNAFRFLKVMYTQLRRSGLLLDYELINRPVSTATQEMKCKFHYDTPARKKNQRAKQIKIQSTHHNL